MAVEQASHEPAILYISILHGANIFQKLKFIRTREKNAPGKTRRIRDPYTPRLVPRHVIQDCGAQEGGRLDQVGTVAALDPDGYPGHGFPACENDFVGGEGRGGWGIESVTDLQEGGAGAPGSGYVLHHVAMIGDCRLD